MVKIWMKHCSGRIPQLEAGNCKVGSTIATPSKEYFMRYHHFIFVLLMHVTSNGAIQGKVVDSYGFPLSGAKVRLSSSSTFVLTDSCGNFSLSETRSNHNPRYPTGASRPSHNQLFDIQGRHLSKESHNYSGSYVSGSRLRKISHILFTRKEIPALSNSVTEAFVEGDTVVIECPNHVTRRFSSYAGAVKEIVLEFVGRGKTVTTHLFSVADSLKEIGCPRIIVDFPFKGGMSPDRKFLGTSYSQVYLYNVDTRKAYQLQVGVQGCNSSISLDTNSFPGCQAFMPFAGPLYLFNPDLAPGQTEYFDMNGIVVIADTSNTMKWSIHKGQFDSVDQIQDSEWTTHPEFLCLLGGKRKLGIQIYDWSGYLIRIRDKQSLRIVSNGMIEQSDIHVWVGGNRMNRSFAPSTFDSNGMNSYAAVTSFVGFSEAKVAYMLRDNFARSFIRVVTYQSGDVEIADLVSPTFLENGEIQDLLFSPDGKYIASTWFDRSTFIPSSCVVNIENSRFQIIRRNSMAPHWMNSTELGRYELVFAASQSIGLVVGPFSQ